MATKQQLKNKKILIVSTHLPAGGFASAKWLLDQGAHVTVVTSASGDSLVVARRLEAYLKKIAADGKAYEHLRARLATVAKKPSEQGFDIVLRYPADELALFCRAWPKKIIGIRGQISTSVVAPWAAHIIGDAVVVDTRSPMTTVEHRARIALVELA